MEDIIDSWLASAESCWQRGDMASMRACGRQLLEEAEAYSDQAQKKIAKKEALALLAEASIYLGELPEAKAYIDKIYEMEREQENHVSQQEQQLRARFHRHLFQPAQQVCLRELLAKALYHGVQYELDKALPYYQQLVDAYRADRRLQAKAVMQAVAIRGYSFYADSCVLAGEVRIAEALTMELSKMAAEPEAKAMFYSKALFLSNYRGIAPEEARQNHEKYVKLLPKTEQFHHDREKRRQPHSLRIGYLSPDFRVHAAAYFFTPLLKLADRQKFTIYGYSNGETDHVTQRFKAMADKWHNLQGKSAKEIATQIYQDRIDILVDLSGHSQNNCLPVLAYKPAPVQVSGIGYINTTGMEAVDYFLTDKYCQPDSHGPTGFTEKLLKLPDCHLCYSPGLMRQIKAAGRDAPAMKNGYITFGCFNNYDKVTEQMLLIWRNILDNLPGSLLVLKNKTCSIDSGREFIYQRWARLGGKRQQLELRPYSQDYLRQYEDIDIALDTAPYNGGLTTCDALFMGVPVIALAGNSHGSRYGVTLLTAAGLPELVADNQRHYIMKAQQLAKNGQLLNKLHHELPGQLLQSQLMNGKAYMAELENKYQKIWAEYIK